MKTTITLLRTGSAVAAAGLLVGMLSACTPDSKPAPKPTKSAAFATDEEAFAAAEATYAAYVEALNATDLRDSLSFRPVFEWLTGTALASERENLSYLRAENVTRKGETRFDTFTPVSSDDGSVVAHVCLDVTSVDLLDANGNSVTPVERIDRRALRVTFVPSTTTTGLKIASNHAPEGFSCE
ncbi:hypothetical protein AB0N59_08560 [Microbacterium sp. NPDC089321]|uniref:hypothetical protein n=1 Tax=Microbacterium sp. NPDC089321 TaxID=3155183 RepID=UPI0034173198